MGGMIGLRSEVGEGSTFYFEIPLQLPFKKCRSLKAAHNPVFHEEEKPLTILVAEDNKINQKWFAPISCNGLGILSRLPRMDKQR
jgi:hypothetical protein